MSFLNTMMDIPFWLLVFILVCAAPAWVRWYRKFYRKFIKTGLLKRKFNAVKENAEGKVDVLKKATENWNASLEKGNKKNSKGQRSINSTDQPYVKVVLKTLALKGEAGMLIQSIADTLNISSYEIKNSLSYLEDNGFIEAVSGTHGIKYYLLERG